MKIVFVSNYFNHHQKPFCEELYKRIGKGFTFIATTVMREERRRLGYTEDAPPKYVFLAYEGEEQKKQAIAIINEADVVIAGSAPNDMLLERIRAGKLLIRYAERPYKKKASCLKKIYHFLRWHQNDLWKKNVYMLCASAYTSGDFASVGMYRNRFYRWGYFPAIMSYEISELLSKKQRATLLWCGRFLDWKHPDDAIVLARRLREDGYSFCLNMVGTGIMEDELRRLVSEYGLDDAVHFLGSMPPEQVRQHMENAGIYLFTSDRQEGWGAVLNESMNSGCAVVASHAIGSVPCLLRNGENGLIYESGNVDMLYEKVRYLLDHREEQNRMGRAAYDTIRNEWNAEIATERLLHLVGQLLSGEKYPDLYKDGPCSRTEMVREDRFRKNL